MLHRRVFPMHNAACGGAACELRRAPVRAYIEELLPDVLEGRI